MHWSNVKSKKSDCCKLLKFRNTANPNGKILLALSIQKKKNIDL